MTTSFGSDEGLIGGIEPGEIRLLDYDPGWPKLFQQHAANISIALRDVALRIEHIGSTSVPGLSAKPIIDILLVVENSANEASYLPPLLKAGYELRVREPALDEHRMLRTPAKTAHIHVYSRSSKEIERYLVFRDRLRSNTSERELYFQRKRELAAQTWSDMNAYAHAKTDVIEGIIQRAVAQRASL